MHKPIVLLWNTKNENKRHKIFKKVLHLNLIYVSDKKTHKNENIKHKIENKKHKNENRK